MPRTRSGRHITKRGDVWYYRRIVPGEYRRAFGQTVVAKSLNTASETEAERLEKVEDVEFERRLRRAKDDANPGTRRARIAQDIIEKTPSHSMAQWGVAYLPPEDREAVRPIIDEHYGTLDTRQQQIGQLAYEIEQALSRTPLAPDVWQRCRDGILSVVRQHVANVTGAAPVAPSNGIHTLEWAFAQWKEGGQGDRATSTMSLARRHFDAFAKSSKLVMLADVRRSHVLTWRKELMDAGEHKPKSINQRLQLVTAILRTGWRDAEMSQPDLKAIMIPEPDDSGRGAWTREEILKVLNLLKPGSWQAWVYLIGLTTSTRLGEPVAARRSWWNSKTGFIELRDRRLAKADKEHAMPIIECLREPFSRYVEGRTEEGFLFDAPRPKTPDVPISNVASEAINRLFKKAGVDRVFHELRDTWIEEARHSDAKKELWEIISGHSKATVSDRYGGEKPEVLSQTNETICKFLTGDPEIMTAINRLVT